MKDVDWNGHRVALAVLQTGGIGAAARALGVSAPTVSRQLAAYEAHVGGPIAERRPDGAVPTALGAALLESLRRAEQAVSEVGRAARMFENQPVGRVRVAALPLFVAEFLMPHLKSLVLAYPRIDIQFLVHHDVANLARGEADIAIRTAPPTQENLLSRRVASSRLGAYVARDCVSQSPLPWVDWPEEVPVQERRWLDAVAPARHIVLRIDDAYGQLRACRAGLGAAVMPDLLARRFPELVPVPGLPVGPDVPLWMVRPDWLRGVPRVDAVWDWLVARFSETRSASASR